MDPTLNSSYNPPPFGGLTVPKKKVEVDNGNGTCQDGPSPLGGTSVFNAPPPQQQAPQPGTDNSPMKELDKATAAGINVSAKDYGIGADFKSKPGATSVADSAAPQPLSKQAALEKVLKSKDEYPGGYNQQNPNNMTAPPPEKKGYFANLFGKLGDFLGAIFGGGRNKG